MTHTIFLFISFCKLRKWHFKFQNFNELRVCDNQLKRHPRASLDQFYSNHWQNYMVENKNLNTSGSLESSAPDYRQKPLCDSPSFTLPRKSWFPWPHTNLRNTILWQRKMRPQELLIYCSRNSGQWRNSTWKWSWGQRRIYSWHWIGRWVAYFSILFIGLLDLKFESKITVLTPEFVLCFS